MIEPKTILEDDIYENYPECIWIIKWMKTEYNEWAETVKTECNRNLIFLEENDYKFCPYCGKQINRVEA